MPKNKHESDSDSSSDTSVEDAQKPVVKKAKKSSSTSTASRRLKNKQGEAFWELDRNKRVTVREFKGKVYVDIREFYEKDGDMLPGKKGISLNLEQYNMFKRVMDEVDEAVSEM